jgi:hypothetical protein
MKTKSILKFIIITLSFCLTACDEFKSEPEPPFNPAIEFLKTYRHIKETEKLEDKIPINETIKQYKLIEQKLLNIRHKDPDWNSFIIDYRLEKTSKTIKRLEKNILSNLPNK